VTVRETLARGRARLPYRLVGDLRMLAWHDRIVARRLRRTPGSVDVVHAWPGASVATLETARELGIVTVLERPNTHTRFAYEVVARECERLGVELPRDHEHAFNAEMLAREEREYALADFLLCPSDFVRRTFIAEGFSEDKLLRHSYGYDEKVFYPGARVSPQADQFTMLFVGVAAVRKGLHFALEAWLRSPAHEHGTFIVAGELLPSYAEKLASMLEHPSVKVLGHSTEVPELMRAADVFTLPSIEEGSALACAEALASGAVPVVSAAASGHCRQMENSLIHPVGDVEKLASDITRLYRDRALLNRLRAGALVSASSFTWARAGEGLVEIYSSVAARAPVGITRKLDRAAVLSSP
jgi:glycosyltransferase involved in cell wall biosynthesis